MSRLQVSRIAIDLIESFEGFRAKAAVLKSGAFTIGFGHSATAREGMQITREQAEELLRWDLRPIEDLIRRSAHAPLSQNQFDALVSFAFNIGAENFLQSETLRHINQGEPVAAAIAMSAWRRANVNGKLIIVDALVRRRYAEANLFFEVAGPRAAVPTYVITPKLDYSAALLAPDTANIKEIIPTKTDGEFVIKQVALPQTSENLDGETAIKTTPIIDTRMQQSIPQSEVDAILEAKLGDKILPFPSETNGTALQIENHENAANQSIELQDTPANDVIPETTSAQVTANAKPHDVFKGQGIELKAPMKNSIDWFNILPWVIGSIGLGAAAFGLFQMNQLQLLDLFKPNQSKSVPIAIDNHGLRAILLTFCGLAALILSLLSLGDKDKT